MRIWSPRDIAFVAALGAAWFAAGALALHFFPAERGLAAVWPASGIALGALLLRGVRFWPGVALGSAALGAWTGLTPAENLALTSGNVLEAVAGARLALAAAGGPARMSNLRGVLSILGPGVIAGTAAGALVCTLLMTAGGRQTASILALEPWAAWLGNAAGALLVTPVILSWGRKCGQWTVGRRPREAAAFAAIVLLAGAFVFSRMPVAYTANPVPYLLFPLFFWAALRFGIREVAGLLLLVGSVAVVATCNGYGPFSAGTPVENLVSLYLFLAVAVVPTLILSALIAERAAAQESLAKSEREHRLVVENQSELIACVLPDMAVTFASPSLLAFLAGAPESVVGHRLDLPVHEDDRPAMDAAWASLFGPEGRCRSEFRVQGRNGWCWLSWSGQREPDGRAAVIVGRDVTARRLAEEQAKAHLSQLAHASRMSAMGEMATAIAHEVNQPLAAIQTFAEASGRLIRQGDVDIPTLEGALTRIAGEAARAGEVIRRTRRFVRNEPAQAVDIEPEFLVGEVVRIAAADARESDIVLGTRLARGLPHVTVDPIQIQQVLLNLVLNAIEAINAGRCPKREIVVSTARAGSSVEFSVSDSGPGIADADRLFEPFHTTKAEGLGIGLAISRSLVEAHGGRLSGESLAGGGALFRFTLPAASARNVAREADALPH